MSRHLGDTLETPLPVELQALDHQITPCSRSDRIRRAVSRRRHDGNGSLTDLFDKAYVEAIESRLAEEEKAHATTRRQLQARFCMGKEAELKMKEAVAERELTIHAKEAKITELQRLLKNMEEEPVSLQRLLQEAVVQKEEMSNAMQEKDRRIWELQAQLELLREQATSLEKAMVANKAAKIALEIELSTANQHLDDAKKLLEEEVGLLQAHKDVNEGHLQAAINKLEGAAQSSESENAMLQGKAQSLQQRLEEMRSFLKQQQQQNGEREQALHLESAAHTETHKNLTAALAENQTLREYISSVDKEFSSSRISFENWQQQQCSRNEQLEAEIAKLKEASCIA